MASTVKPSFQPIKKDLCAGIPCAECWRRATCPDSTCPTQNKKSKRVKKMNNWQERFSNGVIYEKKVAEFLKQRGIENIEMIGQVDDHPNYYKGMGDIWIPSLKVRIEVKGTKREYRNGSRGSFKIRRKSYKNINLFAFVVGVRNSLIVFVTKSDFLDLVTRGWLKGNDKKEYRHLYPNEVIDKAIGNPILLRDEFMAQEVFS